MHSELFYRNAHLIVIIFSLSLSSDWTGSPSTSINCIGSSTWSLPRWSSIASCPLKILCPSSIKRPSLASPRPYRPSNLPTTCNRPSSFTDISNLTMKGLWITVLSFSGSNQSTIFFGCGLYPRKNMMCTMEKI